MDKTSSPSFEACGSLFGGLRRKALISLKRPQIFSGISRVHRTLGIFRAHLLQIFHVLFDFQYSTECLKSSWLYHHTDPSEGFSPEGFSPSPIMNVENFIQQQALQCIGSVFYPLLSINGGQNPGGQNPGDKTTEKSGYWDKNPELIFRGRTEPRSYKYSKCKRNHQNIKQIMKKYIIYSLSEVYFNTKNTNICITSKHHNPKTI